MIPAHFPSFPVEFHALLPIGESLGVESYLAAVVALRHACIVVCHSRILSLVLALP